MGEAWNKVQKRRQAKIKLSELWNMRDINYGFPAIAHRFKVLQGVPEDVSESKLVGLSSLLIAIYGVGYIKHPRLTSLVEKKSRIFLDIILWKNLLKNCPNRLVMLFVRSIIVTKLEKAILIGLNTT
jgi:hypothetical protein